MRDDAPDAADLALAPADLLWAAGSVCNLAGVSFEPALLQRDCPPPCSVAQLVAVLGRMGLRARVRAAGAVVPASLLPAIVFLHPGAGTGGAGGAATVRPVRVALLVRADADRVLLFHAGGNEPATLPLARYREAATGQVLVVDASPTGGDGADDDARAQGFGWRWFATRLLRHRRSLRDLLAASLAVQLLALAAPLLSQVVIDKVIPHEVAGTLVVQPSPATGPALGQRNERSTELFAYDSMSWQPWRAWLGLRHTRIDRSSVRTATTSSSVASGRPGQAWMPMP